MYSTNTVDVVSQKSWMYKFADRFFFSSIHPLFDVLGRFLETN